MDYGYVRGDLIKKPQNYQMSSYLGIDFLNAYERSRKTVLNILSRNLTVKNLEEVCKQHNYNLYSNFSFEKSKVHIDTKELLIQILWGLIKESKTNDIRLIIDIFVKKFEIKKQLFTYYSYDFKEISDDCSLLINYCLLSVIVLLQYEKTHNLKYLNVALKINDTLCSQIHKMDDPKEIYLLRCSLEKEVHFILKLCHKKRIRNWSK